MRVRYLGGPTAILEIGGVRLLTDPTFDPPGDYAIGERVLTKTKGPALESSRIGRVDAVLLSHDQHPDNLDRAGREYLKTVPVVFSTAAARERLGDPVRALPSWEQAELRGAGGAALRLTGVPARHGPEGSEHLVGDVAGFVLSGSGLPTIYVSVDNASLDLVRVTAERLGPVDVALLNAGAAQTAVVEGAFLTLTSELAAEAVRSSDRQRRCRSISKAGSTTPRGRTRCGKPSSTRGSLSACTSSSPANGSAFGTPK